MCETHAHPHEDTKRIVNRIARTSAYYAIAPFIGVLLSLVIFRDWPGWLFFAALALMIAATVLVTKDQAGSEANE